MTGASRSLPFALPRLDAVLLRTRAEALAALRAAGWRPWVIPIGLDAERRRLLNVDLTEPDVACGKEPDVVAVAHVEADRAGRVTLLEVTAAVPASPEDVAAALLGDPGPSRVGGGAEAREWVWGPETGGGGEVAGEPVRLWICAERAYGDRLWAVASIVRR
ncbi:MAG TPA: hypothetical protein VM753_06045 [Anaeromyxobacter sp.]|nr:hypothetical protein [Anaeromyxobacter sp.]